MAWFRNQPTLAVALRTAGAQQSAEALLASAPYQTRCHSAVTGDFVALGRADQEVRRFFQILAPVLRRKEERNEEPTESASAVAGFRAAYVFDITQTDGKELPAIGIVQGDPKDCTVRLPSLRARGRVPLSASVFVADHLRPQRREPESLSRTVRGSDFTIFAIH